MGVDVRTWVDVVKSHPLQFKFEGLTGYHTDVRVACTHDERFMDDWMYKEHTSIKECILDFLEPYIDFLAYRLRVGQHDKGLIDDCHEPDYSEELMNRLEEVFGECRFEFAQFYSEPQDQWAFIEEDEPDWYLKEHPPEEVWNAAYGCGFPVENIVYICPSCGAHAMTTDELEDNGHHHYCSLCGSEYLEPHDFRQMADLAKFAHTFELCLWPMMKPEDVVWWEDPADDACSCLAEVVNAGKAEYEDVISLRNAAGGEIECSRHELRQATVEEYHQFHKEKEACQATK